MKTAVITTILVSLSLTNCSNKMGIFDLFSGNKKEQLVSVKGFEKEDFNNLKDYYAENLSINNQEINIDLNFDNKKTNNEELKSLNEFIGNIGEFDNQNLEYIKNDFENANSTVREYIDHHISDMDKEELGKIIDLKDTSLTNEQKLLQKLKLRRVGIYPNEKSYFAIYDYTIGMDFSQYLIVIKTDKDGKIIDLNVES